MIEPLKLESNVFLKNMYLFCIQDESDKEYDDYGTNDAKATEDKTVLYVATQD